MSAKGQVANYEEHFGPLCPQVPAAHDSSNHKRVLESTGHVAELGQQLLAGHAGAVSDISISTLPLSLQ